ncbi:MAG: PDZ domain-containing protein, partial [Candidatus Latescibacterota bacterium]
TAWAGGEKCTYDTQMCLDHMAKMNEAGWSGVDGKMVENGYKVTKVFADGPAKPAGIKVGDVMTKINGTSKDDASFQQVYMEAMKPGNTVTFTVARSGHEKEIKVKLVAMPEDVFVTMVGRHMLDHAETQTAGK